MSSDPPQVLPFQELAKHNHKADCWLLISNKVYNVTPFLYEHPGGQEILLTSVGKDATEDFENIGHSESAREMMKRYFVGDIDISTIPPKRIPAQSPSDPVTTVQPKPSSGLLVQFLVSVFLFVLAFAFIEYLDEQD